LIMCRLSPYSTSRLVGILELIQTAKTPAPRSTATEVRALLVPFT
jgi:hypothetical protein